jgi:hypothetical protein
VATGWTVGALPGDQRIQYVFKGAKVQLMWHIPTWEWTVFGCQTVPIGCDKYVIRSVSLVVHMLAAAVDALRELQNLH